MLQFDINNNNGAYKRKQDVSHRRISSRLDKKEFRKHQPQPMAEQVSAEIGNPEGRISIRINLN